jgi:hypothetical protein
VSSLSPRNRFADPLNPHLPHHTQVALQQLARMFAFPSDPGPVLRTLYFSPLYAPTHLFYIIEQMIMGVFLKKSFNP